MPKKDPADIWNTDINKSIYADHLGLTPQFVKENEDRLAKIEDMVKNSLKVSKEDDPSRVFNTMKQLQSITRNTFVSDTKNTSLNEVNYGFGRGYMTDSGFKPIGGEIDNRDDTEIFNFHASVFANYRNLVSEYRNIARLIPEVYRCADMKARDILSINEITKRAITNIYMPESDIPNSERTDPSKLYNDPINKLLTEEVLDRYGVEEKLQRYIKTSLIEGARPVAIFPFRDIVQMAEMNASSYARKFSDFNMKKEQYGQEGYMDLLNEFHMRNQTLVPDAKSREFHIYSQEKLEDGTTTVKVNETNWKKYRDRVINQFVSQENLNEYYTRGMEDIKDKITKAEQDAIYDIFGSNVIDKDKQIETTKEKYRDLHGKVKIDGSLSDHFKNQIFGAIQKIDSNIEFYDQSELAMGVAINNMRRLMQYTGGYHEDPKYGVIAYGASQKTDKQMKDSVPYYDQDPLYKLENQGKGRPRGSVLDGFADFEGDTKDLLNDCLIKEYDAEDVIPIIVSGKHVGYYLIELAPYTGNVESVNKRNCNFTDIFLNLGFQNDPIASPSPSSSGAFSSGISGVPMGGVGPVADVPSLGVTGAGSTVMAGGLDVSGFDSGPLGDDATHRNNVMKKIIFSVLKQKLNKHDIEDDETFTDTIMSLIRDGAIVQSKIKIIYIPEKYMCYFTPDLDGNGIPQSFLKNCLYTCYEKISVNLNNIMTRLTRTATRDKIILNVGKQKSIGKSIREIENALTTRQLNVESPFTSLARVLKASSLTETIIVPVYDGEQLFEYEDLTTKNEVPPNDDLEQRLSNDIVTALKCPITITNPYQEEDFASLAASRNAEYRFDIIAHQKKFSLLAAKFIKLLIVGSGIYDKIRETKKDFTLKEIQVLLNPPESLNIQHANDLFGTISGYVDNIIGITIDPNDDTDTTNWKRFVFKQKLYQRLMPALGLDEYINEAENLTADAQKQALSKRVERSVNDQIVNTSFKPLITDKDGHVVENDSNDGNESDDGGW